MSFDARFLGGEIQEPIIFSATAGISIQMIKEDMEIGCRESGIPAEFSISSVTEGGIFNKTTYPALLINHPNPPQEYCSQLYILAKNTVIFRFIGRSKAFKEKYESESVARGESSALIGLKYLFKQPSPVAMELELTWHRQVISVFNGLVRFE